MCVGKIECGRDVPSTIVAHEEAKIFNMVVLVEREDVEAHARKGFALCRDLDIELINDVEVIFVAVVVAAGGGVGHVIDAEQ